MLLVFMDMNITFQCEINIIGFSAAFLSLQEDDVSPVLILRAIPSNKKEIENKMVNFVAIAVQGIADSPTLIGAF